jgi:hypothetical protein
VAPVVEEGFSPDRGLVFPEAQEGFLQLPGAGRWRTGPRLRMPPCGTTMSQSAPHRPSRCTSARSGKQTPQTLVFDSEWS